LAFKESRALGIVGVLILILVAPLAFGALLVVAGLAYYFLLLRRRHEFIPRANVLPPDEASRRRRGLGLLVLATAAAGLFAFAYAPPVENEPFYSVVQGVTRSAPVEELIVLRTPGGLLQTSTIEADEVLDATFTHRILGVKIGETAPRIRVRAFYNYHVKLDPEWRVIRKGAVITALAPPLTPGLPVAVDTATYEASVAGTWLLVPITGDDDLEALQRTITAKLALKASSREYRQRALEDSRRTVTEFIKTWAAQAGHADVKDVRVLFEGEPVRSIDALSG